MTRKRNLPENGAKEGPTKRNKKNYYPKAHHGVTSIEPGLQGIIATCDRGKEGRCVGEMYELLKECVSRMYPGEANEDHFSGEDDIEAALKKEISNFKEKRDERGIASIKLDAQCVTFFRLKRPYQPTEIVKNLCKEAVQPDGKKVRFIQRLTPITRTGKATINGLTEVAKVVLEPHFHKGQQGVKFAIRPTLRNHNALKRNEVIETVARCVGPHHIVDLKNPDLTIVVELYKNICGISVVKDFEKSRKFNLHELQVAIESPTRKVARADTRQGWGTDVSSVAPT